MLTCHIFAFPGKSTPCDLLKHTELLPGPCTLVHGLGKTLEDPKLDFERPFDAKGGQV